MTDHVLDARGLQCPLPVLRANKMLKSLPAGAHLQVLATDAAAPKDFEAFCKTTGHILVSSTEAEGFYTVVLRRAAGPE